MGPSQVQPSWPPPRAVPPPPPPSKTKWLWMIIAGVLGAVTIALLAIGIMRPVMFDRIFAAVSLGVETQGVSGDFRGHS
ncbi:MAG TPA: hypothetical protein VI483_03045 [Candidatus Paceibacterota bacterium]